MGPCSEGPKNPPHAKILLFTLVLAGRAFAEQPSLEKRVDDLEKRLKAIESISVVALALGNQKPDPASTPQADAPLQLLRWGHSLAHGEYSFETKHKINYVLKYCSDNSIKLVNATLVFTDLLGEAIFQGGISS